MEILIRHPVSVVQILHHYDLRLFSLCFASCGVIPLTFFGCYFSSSNYGPGGEKNPEDIVLKLHCPHGLLVPSQSQML